MNEVRMEIRVSQKCNEATIITGSGRSGTTILGNVLHSFKCVEYAYEPPMLVSLFPLIGHINENAWKLLYETYLYEELLINALAGRSINCNRADDSSIYNAKPEQLIEERLTRSLRKVEAEQLAKDSRIIYKLPDIVAFMPQLKKYYPGTNIIITSREAPYVFYSNLEKGWFSDKSLREENRIWPNRFLNGIKVPFWVDPHDDEQWVGMDELHRIAYYYIRDNEAVKDIPDCIIVKYKDMVENPKKIAMTLAERLGLTFGEKTEQILSTISYKRKDADKSILSKLKPEIREKVCYYSNLS